MSSIFSRRIKISGTSGAVFDECILFESMSKEIVYKSEDSLMLLYLDDVLHFLTCLSEEWVFFLFSLNQNF